MNLATTSCSLTKLQCLEQVWRIVDMAPDSSTLAWKIPWTEEPVGCSPCGRLESDTTELLCFHFSLSCIGEGNGNPLNAYFFKDIFVDVDHFFKVFIEFFTVLFLFSVLFF